MFDDLLDLLPDGATLTILKVEPNGDVLVNVRTDQWQLGYTGQDPEALLARAWEEQATYEAQQAIKQLSEDYKVKMAALLEARNRDKQQLEREHIDKKARAIQQAKAAVTKRRKSKYEHSSDV